MDWAVSANSGIFLYARVPQILTNARTKSTGALSGTTTFLQLAGGAGACAAG